MGAIGCAERSMLMYGILRRHVPKGRNLGIFFFVTCLDCTVLSDKEWLRGLIADMGRFCANSM